jgi:hypothetical protein
VQCKRTCFSSWTLSSASHKLQVREEVEFQVAVSTRREWTRSLNEATLRITLEEGQEACTWEERGRMGNHSSLCRQCAPLVISKRFFVALVISKRFAVALSRVAIR